MKIKEACEAVADLFEALPETWTKKADARDADGNEVMLNDPSAVSWCAVSGVVAAAGCSSHEARNFLLPAAWRLFKTSPVSVNDYGGRRVAIRLLREAAK